MIHSSKLKLISYSDLSLCHYLRSDVKVSKLSCGVKTVMGCQTKYGLWGPMWKQRNNHPELDKGLKVIMLCGVN